MAAEWSTIVLPAPKEEWLTEADVLQFLGDISSRTLDTYIQNGEFAAGIPFGRDRKWPREAVVLFYLTKRLSPQLKRKPDEEAK